MVRRSRSADPNHRLAPTLLRYAPNSGAAGVAPPVVRQPHPAGPNHRPANNLCPAHAYARLPVLTSARSSGPYAPERGGFSPFPCMPSGVPLPSPWHLLSRWKLLLRAGPGRTWGVAPPPPSAPLASARPMAASLQGKIGPELGWGTPYPFPYVYGQP